MKTNFYKLLALFLVLSSCSSSDSSNNDTNNETIYLPLTTGNYWTYDVETVDMNQQTTNERDSLYVSGDILFSGISHKKMQTLALPFGFYSSTLRNNGLRKDGNSVKMSGIGSYDLGLGTPIDLTINDFVILKKGAALNEQLSSIDGVFSQTISGYPLDFTYNLKSVNVSELPTFTSPNGDVYTDVIKSKLVLNLTVSTTQLLGGIPITITILPQQDVATSYQYYAKNIGMVHTNTIITYQLNSQIPSTITLPIPASGSRSQNEFLDTYLAN